MRTIIIRIKQFFFYLGYELSLFQKIVAGTLTAILITAAAYVAPPLNLFPGGNLLGASIVSGEPAGDTLTANIRAVDTTTLLQNGNVVVSYVLSTRPDGEYTIIGKILDKEKTEIAKTETKSSDQTATITITVPETKRSAPILQVEIAIAAGDKTADASLSIQLGQGGGTGTGSIVTASGSVVPPKQPSPSLLPSPRPQCIANGQACVADQSCCSTRCARVKVRGLGGGSIMNVCLPKR